MHANPKVGCRLRRWWRKRGRTVKQDRNIVGGKVGQSQIGFSIAVEVAHSNRARRRSCLCRSRGKGGETAGAIVHQSGYRVFTDVAYGQIEEAIAVEIRRDDREG